MTILPNWEKVQFLTVLVKLGLTPFLKEDKVNGRLILCLMVEAACIRVETENGTGHLVLL